MDDRKDELEGQTVDELRDLAAEHDIEGRSSMKKDELVEALDEELPPKPEPRIG